MGKTRRIWCEYNWSEIEPFSSLFLLPTFHFLLFSWIKLWDIPFFSPFNIYSRTIAWEEVFDFVQLIFIFGNIVTEPRILTTKMFDQEKKKWEKESPAKSGNLLWNVVKNFYMIWNVYNPRMHKISSITEKS